MRPLIILLTIFGGAFGQPVSVGVKGAVQIADNPLAGHDDSRRGLVGPSVEVRLPAGFAVEADALYRRVGYSYSYSLLGPTAGFYSARVRGNSWEFPVLGKYYFQRRLKGWQPFAGTGWALRTVQYHTD